MAATLVGGAFLSAFLQVFFDRMASRKFLDFFRGQKLSGDLLNKLKIALESGNAVLEDAHEKELTNPTGSEWVDQLFKAVYDAEDILDEIATNALQGTQVQTDVKKLLEDVVESLEYLARKKDVLGLKEGVGGESSKRLPTTSLVQESHIFGRDDDKEKIIDLLIPKDANVTENMRVIGIVGMGGIGKTTLAQLVYNDQRVESYFTLKAWVCVSPEFDAFKVTKTILDAVTSSTCDIKDLNQLQLALKKTLMGKKFLFVLDDVWNEIYADWELLSNAFQSGARGSTVIVTSRNENVASTMRTIETHYLKELQDEYCWALFAKHAFHGGESDSYPELEKIGRQIVGKCKGLPLAAKVIGALLRSERDADEWDQVLKSELWALQKGERMQKGGRVILSALLLSYKYLPSHLKQCFAYCSIFPKGHIFEKDQLVLLWMAEGFLQQSINKTMEEVGDEYFCDLVSRSLFQKYSGARSGFVMHHLIIDLAIFVSSQLSFRLEGDYSNQIVYKTRHLSYLRTIFDEKFEALYNAKKLRTFLLLQSSYSYDVYSSKKVSHNLLSMLTCLRVLSFSQCINITELSDSIGKIIHLRYLDLSSTRIERLPDSICELCNLQTLKLSSCVALVELPRNVHKLINLRHLDLSSTLSLQWLPDSICELNDLQTLKLSGCKDLISLPREINKLTNLRSLDIIDTGIREMPIQLGRLKRLRMLTTFIVGEDSGSCIQELEKLVNLRGKLSISKLQNVQLSTVEAILEDIKYLQELVLEWNASDTSSLESQRNDQKIVLDSLKPQTNLKSLVIKYYGGEHFPDWVGCSSFANIASLRLENCKYCCTLPPFGQLPSLKDLSVVGFERVVKVDHEFYGSESSSFGALKVLRFKDLPNWEEWFSFGAENEGGAFPKLEELYMLKCPKLTRAKGLPIHLPYLAKLEINECPEPLASLSSAPNVREMQLIKCNEALLNDLPSGMRLLVVKGFVALKSLPERIMDSNSHLQELRVYDCSSLVQLSTDGLPSTLTVLTVGSCEKLKLPMHLNYCRFLEKLHLTSSCDSLQSLQLEVFPKLYEIKIRGCRRLKSLTVPDLHEDDLVVVRIEIRDCPNFVSFPKGGLRAPNLTNFWVANCEMLRSLPDKMDIFLRSLKYLSLENCPKIESFPEGGLPSNLNSDSIHINGCERLGAVRRG